VPPTATTTTKCKNRVLSPLSIMKRVTSLLASITNFRLQRVIRVINNHRFQFRLRFRVSSITSSNNNNFVFPPPLLLRARATFQTPPSVWDRWESPWPWRSLRGRGPHRRAILFAATAIWIPARTGCFLGAWHTSATFSIRPQGTVLVWAWGRFRRHTTHWHWEVYWYLVGRIWVLRLCIRWIYHGWNGIA